MRDLDYADEVTGAALEGARLRLHLVFWLAFLFVIAALGWASMAEIDQVTRAEGRVIPSGEVQVVQNLEGGILAAVLVREGDTVASGQVLLRIDDTRFAASHQESQLRALALEARIARLESESKGVEFNPAPAPYAEHPRVLDAELRLYASRRSELNAGLAVLNQQARQRQQEIGELRAERSELRRSAGLADKELGLTRPLVDQGAISEVELLRLERQVSELQGRLTVIGLAIPRARSARAEAERRIEERKAKFRAGAQAELVASRNEAAQLRESLRALQDRVRRTEVRSPVKGTIKQISVNTVGGTIKPGMDLVEIVPTDDTLLVEARLRPADIAFLRPGQEAVVKLTAYDFAIFGGLAATLEHISADTITDERGERHYKIRVRTERGFLGPETEPLPIIPGMTATVDLLSGKKTVLEYLLKPIRRAQERALREG